MDERTMRDALKHRRSYYSISNKSLISDEEIESIVNFAARYVPSGFNSQSTRLVLLLGDNHKKLWNIVKDTLKKIVSAEKFPKTEAKINDSFLAGYGTVLFFEDQDVVKQYQKDNPTYADKFPHWSDHTSGMHQLVIWTLLEDAGFGASMQHYNPLIDKEVLKTWRLPASWNLVAQMPFGVPLAEPGPDQKGVRPLEERVKVFR